MALPLHAPHWFSEGIQRVSLPSAADSIEPQIQRLLIEKGFLRAPQPLDRLHRALPLADQALDDNYQNAVTRALYQQDDRLHAAYHEVLRALRPRIGEDFVFQRAPIVRVHFPATFPGKLRTESGLGLQQHSDTLGGHPFELLQGWLPLCDCEGTAALHIASREDGVAILSHFLQNIGGDEALYRRGLDAFYRERDRDAVLQRRIVSACLPCPLRRGELLLFEPRCVHGGVENRSDRTRVSLDFRLMPCSVYDAFVRSPQAAQAPRFVRGAIFHPASIDAL
jgi:hypothetical protein